MRAKLAALLPLPAFLRRRGSGLGDGGATTGATHTPAIAQWSAQAASTMDPSLASFAKAVAAAATIALAGVGANVATHRIQDGGHATRTPPPSAIAQRLPGVLSNTGRTGADRAHARGGQLLTTVDERSVTALGDQAAGRPEAIGAPVSRRRSHPLVVPTGAIPPATDIGSAPGTIVGAPPRGGGPQSAPTLGETTHVLLPNRPAATRRAERRRRVVKRAIALLFGAPQNADTTAADTTTAQPPDPQTDTSGLIVPFLPQFPLPETVAPASTGETSAGTVQQVVGNLLNP